MKPIDINSLNLFTLAPMLITIGGGLLILIIDLIKENLHKSLYVVISILVLFVSFGAVLSLNLNERGFFDLITTDGLSILGQLIILGASMLFIPLALTEQKFHEYSFPEFFGLFLMMVGGFQFMVATDNLILIFVGLETASLALYTLIALHNTRESHEAAIKYFTMGAMAAGFFALGAAAIYALSGSLDLLVIQEVIKNRIVENSNLVPIIGAVILLMVAVAFKVSLIPFHMWTPDVYEGSTAPMAGYMSIVPKIAMMVVAMRIFGLYIKLDIEAIRLMIIAMGVLTMTLSNMMALVQEDVKRMLAYSSISHAGFVMLALSIVTVKSYSSIFLYYILFMFTNLGAFAMLWISRHKDKIHHDRYNHPYTKFAGMVYKNPIAAVIMAIFMLSLTGVPPFSLFWGKLYVISSVVDAGYIGLAIIMALNSAIAAYYYLKLIVYMFLKDPKLSAEAVYANRSRALEVIIGIAAFATVGSIFVIDPLLSFITYLVGNTPI